MVIGAADLQYQQRVKKRCEKSVKKSDPAPLVQSTSTRIRPKSYLNPNPQPPSVHDDLVKTKLPVKLGTLAQTLDRFGVSDRVGAAITTSVLQDLGIVSERESSYVVDRSKVRRAREKSRNNFSSSTIQNSIFGLYFDGRKDKTFHMLDNRRQVIIEEHIVLIGEPGASYIGHAVPKSGRASDVVMSMWNFIENHTNDMCAIGCDGTNINTGKRGGVITLLEQRLQRPLQWLICQLHANELPLRHLINHLDGNTCGPGAFAGPIGKQLINCENMDVVCFEAIDADIPVILKTDLSTEQKYLYEICIAVSSGACPTALSKRNPGKMVHSRWLTTANRILRLYVSCSKPCENLKILVLFIMKVYAPTWFAIKAHPSCIKGAVHLHETISRSRYLSPKLKSIVDPVIQRNAYFGHSENILLAMLFDSRKSVRKLGFQRLLKARSSPAPSRVFTIPELNFNAKEYYDLIPWDSIQLTEPPILKHLTVDELQKVISNPDDVTAVENILKLPCHTQAVERAVKTVTETSVTVCSAKRRDGVIRNKLKARKLMQT